MTAERFRVVAATAAALVLAVVVAAGSGVLPRDTAETVDDLAQLVGAAVAAACCAWTGSRASGPERRWRLLVAAGIGSWGIGQAIWTWARLAGTDIPSPSLADVGYLGLFVFVLPALLVFAAQGARPPPRPAVGDGEVESGRSAPVLVLDGLVVVGSLLTLAWSSALGAVVSSGAPSPAAFAVAVAYPITDLVLVTIVVLLGAVRRVRWRPPLLLLGLGLVAISVSDSFFTWLVSSGAEQIHPLFDAGFVAGPVLIALAAVAPEIPAGSHARRRSALPAWAHLLVPYLPLTARRAADDRADRGRGPARPGRDLRRDAGDGARRHPPAAHPPGEPHAAAAGPRRPPAAVPPRLPRPADRAGQPVPVRRPAGARRRAAPPGRAAGRAPVLRPGRLQDRQRQPRPRRRGRAAAAGRAADVGHRPLLRHGRPARRGRVRGALRGRPGRPGGRGGPAGRGAGGALRAGRRRPDRPVQPGPGGRGRAGARGLPRPAAAPGRRRDVRGEAAGRRPGGHLPARRDADAHRPGPAGAARPGAAARGVRDRGRRAAGALPADRADRGRHDGRAGGARPVDRPGPGRGVAGRLRRGGGAHRAGRRPGRPGAGAGLPGSRDAPQEARPRPGRARERLRHPAARPRPGADGLRRAGAARAARRGAGAGDHRDQPGAGPGRRLPGAAAAPAGRRPGRAGRLRHRLRHAGPPAPAAGRRGEAGPHADHAGPGAGRAAAPLGGVDLPGARHAGRRRGGGDRPPGGRAAPDRLRPRPGLALRPARSPCEELRLVPARVPDLPAPRTPDPSENGNGRHPAGPPAADRPEPVSVPAEADRRSSLSSPTRSG